MLSEVIAFTRYIGEEIGFQLRDGLTVDDALNAPLCRGFIKLPDDVTEEFINWYQTEHSPMVLKFAVAHGSSYENRNADPEPFTHVHSLC